MTTTSQSNISSANPPMQLVSICPEPEHTESQNRLSSPLPKALLCHEGREVLSASCHDRLRHRIGFVAVESAKSTKRKKKVTFLPPTNRGGSIARLCLICHRLFQRPCSVMRAVKSSPQGTMIYVYRYTYMYVRTYIGICTHISDMSSRLKTSFFYFCAILFGFCATRCRGTLRPKLTRSTAMGSAVPTV